MDEVRKSKGGRPKGVKDRGPRRSHKFAIGVCIPGGKTPLEYMLAVMNDEKADLFRRDKMAVAAAPYVHAKISAEEMASKPSGKKALVAALAATAGEGTEWGDDLKSEVAN